MLVVAIGLSFVCAANSAADEPPCNGRAMYIAAHQDDTLLFQSPDLLHDVKSGRCLQTVFLTAGDAGKPQSYWSLREVGAEAAYAQMAGVADEWTESTVVVDGHAVTKVTLDGAPRISIVYMRLPDGGTDGKGFPAYDNQSLTKLWRGGNPGTGTPTIASITAVDGTATYGYAGLIEALGTLIEGFEPRWIATQNFNEGFFEGDHPDHVATAYFAKAAQQAYLSAHQTLAYRNYQTMSMPENVFGSLLGSKSFAFYVYGAHDSGACSDQLSCSGTPYADWLKRQYVTGVLTAGVVARAGDFQETTMGANVTLDGSKSSAAGGKSLTYAWTQTKGPTVTLSDAASATPSFTAPPHPTVLNFSLVVSDGTTASAPDEVTVRVPSSDPTPSAVVGADQTVESGASVSLEGSASWDPNSLPLQYAWIQTGGPLVALDDSATPQPSFTAPTGPVTLTFALVVSNGAQESAPAEVAIAVKGVPPSFTSAGSTAFTTEVSGSFTVTANGSPPAAIAKTAGDLPPGVSLLDDGDGTARLVGTPGKGAAPPGESRAYAFSLEAVNGWGSATQPFTLTVVNPGVAPTVVSDPAAVFEVGRAAAFTVVTSGEPDAAVSLTGVLPEGLGLTANGDGTATLSGVPAAAAAPAGGSRVYELSLRAQNAAGVAVQPFRLTVIGPAGPPPPPPDRPPVFTSGDVHYGLVGNRLDVAIAAGGEPAPTLSLEGAPPAGLAFAGDGPGRARLSGTPRSPGVSYLRIRAAGGGSTAVQDLRLVVERRPTLTSSKLRLRPGHRQRKLVKVVAGGEVTVRCTGRLPAGIRCRPTAAGDVLVESRPRLKRLGVFPLTVSVTSRAGTVHRTLRVRVARGR